MAHTYASLEEAMNFARDEGYTKLWGATSTNRAEALKELEAVSRRVEDWCGRSAFGTGFGPRIGTNRYDGNADSEILLRDDLDTVSSILIRPSLGVSGTTITADTDYYLVNQRSLYEPKPYRRVILHSSFTGIGLRVTEVAGTWTYPYSTVVLTPTAAEAIDISETEIDVSGLTGSTAGTGLSPGMTILIDTEQMYITAVTDSTTDSITVVRAVNGSTAATHLTAAPISRMVYDSRVVDATRRVFLKRWRSRDAGADGGDGGGQAGLTTPMESEETILRRTVGELPHRRAGGVLMAKYTPVTMDLSGPFFTRDPGKTVRGNIRRMMQGLAEEGERAVRDQIASHEYPRGTGWTHDHAVGRAQALTGKPWFLTAVISANTGGMSKADAIRTKAAASSVERRYHPFRRTTTALRKSRAVLAANLTAGLE